MKSILTFKRPAMLVAVAAVYATAGFAAVQAQDAGRIESAQSQAAHILAGATVSGAHPTWHSAATKIQRYSWGYGHAFESAQAQAAHVLAPDPAAGPARRTRMALTPSGSRRGSDLGESAQRQAANLLQGNPVSDASSFLRHEAARSPINSPRQTDSDLDATAATLK